MNEPRRINDILNDVKSAVTKDNNTIGLLMDVMHERGFGILIFLFALPMAIPLPVPPGINLLFSVPLLFLTFQQIYGARKPWLPKSIRNKTYNPQKMHQLIVKAEPWMDKLSYIIRPRLGWMTRNGVSYLIGVFGFLFALCVSIPIPMTNTVPSFAIMIMALGVLMRDGLAILFGMFLGCAWITLLATIGVTGFKAVLSTFL